MRSFAEFLKSKLDEDQSHPLGMTVGADGWPKMAKRPLPNNVMAFAPDNRTPFPANVEAKPAGDDGVAALSKLRSELSRYKPGMVLRVVLPKAHAEILSRLLDQYGE